MTVTENAPDPEKLIARYRRAMERRQPWAGHWQECYAHALPQREAAIMDTAPGAKKGIRLYDGTATDAVDQLAASLLSELTPPWDQWFDFKPGREAPEDVHAQMSEILGNAAAVLQGHFDRSNFAVELMLEPTNVLDSRLDPDRIIPYDEALDYREGNGEPLLRLGDHRLISVSCFWDPSFGRPGRGDASVITAVFTDQEGGYWLQEVAYLTHNPAIVDRIDEATQLCRQAVSFARRNFVPAVTIETNGIGQFLPGLFRRELKRGGLATAVIEHASSRGKTGRILEAFDAVLAAGRLNAHRRVWDTPFVREMREWQPGGPGRDDGLDAVAGCLLAEPVRLGEPDRVHDARSRLMTGWRRASAPVRVSADFDV